LNVFQSMLEPVPAQIDLIVGHRIKHERVVRIWRMTQGEDLSAVLSHSLVIPWLLSFPNGRVWTPHCRASASLAGRALVAPLTERPLQLKQNSRRDLRGGCLKPL
jgi:hypothetical protein